MSNRNDTLLGKLVEVPESVTFVAFDTETTGMWAASHQIVELGAVKCTLNASITGEFQSLIHPGRPIPPEVIPIHGITDEMVRNAPTIELVLKQFLEFSVDADFLIAHNAPFDLAFVRWEAKRSEISLPDLPVLDSCSLARILLPGFGSYSLENLSRELGFIEKQTHRAKDDALLVARLTERIFAAVRELPPTSQKKAIVSVPLNAPLDDAAIPQRLAGLQTAIEESLEIWITYESSTVPWHSRRVQPRFLFGHRGKNYLTAFCLWTRSERTFRLDRVSEMVIVPRSV